MKKVELFTDGACRGNPGPGGWGALLRMDEHEKSFKGFEAHTTNNRMELSAVIGGLRALTGRCIVDITTDSSYVKNGIETWIHSWKARGWRTSDKKPVKNQDLWEILDALTGDHEVHWHWVKGHSGHPENERADQLANMAIDHGLRRA